MIGWAWERNVVFGWAGVCGERWMTSSLKTACVRGYCAPRLWKASPNTTGSIQSLNVFKKKIKILLFKEAFLKLYSIFSAIVFLNIRPPRPNLQRTCPLWLFIVIIIIVIIINIIVIILGPSRSWAGSKSCQIELCRTVSWQMLQRFDIGMHYVRIRSVWNSFIWLAI